MGFHDGLALAMEKHGPRVLLPLQPVERPMKRNILLGWIFCSALLWWQSPWVFLPKPEETWTALHDLWFYQDLGVAALASIRLNIESITIATAISLGLAYLGTIALFEPIVSLVGKLRFLSFYGLGFAFTLMSTSTYEMKISVLVFMVTVFFVVSMVDVIAQVPPEQYDLARTLKMGPWETLWEVVILGQIDQAFIVLRQTAAMAWMMIGTAESMAMSGGGIGALLETSNKHFHMSEVMALQIIVLILGLAQDSLIGWLRGKICPWTLRGDRA